MSAFSLPEGDLVRWQISTTARGGEVPGIYFVPRHMEGPTPLVLIQHPAASSKDDYLVAEVARLWAGRGWVCGGFDAPFHGERVPHDPLAVLREPERFAGIAEQFCAEVTAVIDDLADRFAIDPGRIAFVGYSLGAMLGIHAVATESRIGAAVFCLVGESRLLGPTRDPANPVRGLREIPVRVVAKTDDERVSRADTEALFATIGGEKDLVWLPGGHFEIGPDVADAALDWLKAHL